MESIYLKKINKCRRGNISMGMKILKLKYHIVAFLRIILYKMLFGRRFLMGGVQLSEIFSTYTWKKARLLKSEKIVFLTMVAH